MINQGNCFFTKKSGKERDIKTLFESRQYNDSHLIAGSQLNVTKLKVPWTSRMIYGRGSFGCTRPRCCDTIWCGVVGAASRTGESQGLKKEEKQQESFSLVTLSSAKLFFFS